MTITPATRRFTYSSIKLPDPNFKLSPEEVKALGGIYRSGT